MLRINWLAALSAPRHVNRGRRVELKSNLPALESLESRVLLSASSYLAHDFDQSMLIVDQNPGETERQNSGGASMELQQNHGPFEALRNEGRLPEVRLSDSGSGMESGSRPERDALANVSASPVSPQYTFSKGYRQAANFSWSYQLSEEASTTYTGSVSNSGSNSNSAINTQNSSYNSTISANAGPLNTQTAAAAGTVTSSVSTTLSENTASNQSTATSTAAATGNSGVTSVSTATSTASGTGGSSSFGSSTSSYDQTSSVTQSATSSATTSSFQTVTSSITRTTSANTSVTSRQTVTRTTYHTTSYPTSASSSSSTTSSYYTTSRTSATTTSYGDSSWSSTAVTTVTYSYTDTTTQTTQTFSFTTGSSSASATFEDVGSSTATSSTVSTASGVSTVTGANAATILNSSTTVLTATGTSSTTSSSTAVPTSFTSQSGTVSFTQSGSSTVSSSSVSVTVNNPPEFNDSDNPDAYDFTIYPSNLTLGSLSATDPESDPLTYSLSGTSQFTIDPVTGALAIASGVTLSGGTYSFTAIVHDSPWQASDSANVQVVYSVPNVSLSVIQGLAHERNGDQTAELSVARTGGDLTQPLTVSFDTSSGVAGLGGDYSLSVDSTSSANGSSIGASGASGTITFGANQTSVTVVLTAVADSVLEGDEGATLTLVAAGSSYTIGSASASATIKDSPHVKIEAIQPKAFETTTTGLQTLGGVKGQYAVTLVNPSSITGSVEVPFTWSGTANPPTAGGLSTPPVSTDKDYTLAPSLSAYPATGTQTGHTVTLSSGTSSVMVDLEPLNDGISEGAETAILSLVSSGNYVIEPDLGAATVTIYDAGLLVILLDDDGIIKRVALADPMNCYCADTGKPLTPGTDAADNLSLMNSDKAANPSESVQAAAPKLPTSPTGSGGGGGSGGGSGFSSFSAPGSYTPTLDSSLGAGTFMWLRVELWPRGTASSPAFAQDVFMTWREWRMALSCRWERRSISPPFPRTCTTWSCGCEPSRRTAVATWRCPRS